MSLATIYRFHLDLSDIDRSIYEKLDLRLALHPSESIPYLLTRLIAFALNVEPSLKFSKGLSDPDFLLKLEAHLQKSNECSVFRNRDSLSIHIGEDSYSTDLVSHSFLP